MKKLSILFFFLVLCAATLFAQATEKFSYQAVVRNASNQLISNAPVGVRVSILQGSADGVAVYVETHAATTNANGLLTVEIGGGTAQQGVFADIDWANGPIFLKTETDPAGGSNYTVTSTQQLLSVPYALYAKEAGNGFSGDYNDLRNKPTIPQNVGELTNDAGYITLNDLPEPSKGENDPKETNIIQTADCGEIDLCELVNQLAQQQAQIEEMQNALLPTVITASVSDMTGYTATCGGNVTNNGYDEVTERGVCWATEPNPTVVGNHISDGTGMGEFTITLADLQSSTTYYVRAYAINSVGTAYGEEVIFTTLTVGGGAVVDEKSCSGTPTVTDHEGNVYATVQIGEQCWMRDNLRTTTSPSTGTYLIVADAGWTFTGKQARWYNNDSATYAPMNYGLLYNWNAAVDTFNTAYGETSVNTSGSDAVSLIFTRNRRGICPAGWHLPSEAEWTALANYVGSQSEYTCDNNSNNIAKALASTEGWDSYSGECNPGDQSVTANNATGFSAVPVGKYWLDGFNNASNRTYFWSSPENNYGSSNAYCCSLNFNSPNVGWGHEGKFSGFSVRCLRDESEPVSLTDPTVITLSASIQTSMVTLNGVISNPDDVEITEQGFEWKITENGTYAPVTATGDTMTYNLTGLAANTGYTYRAFVTTATGTIYGGEVNFTTGDTCTIISLPYSEDFESYTTSTASETGVQPDCWEVTTEDVTLTNATKPQLYRGFSTSGSYSLRMKNRCVYAMPELRQDVNINELSMTFQLRQGSAIYRLQVGVVNDEGEFEVVETINNASTEIEEVTVDFSSYTGIGRRIAFRNTLKQSSTIDYSTNYIDDIMLTLLSSGAVVDEKSCSGTPTVTDHEGNVYATVQIGEQCWMRDNLRTTTSPSTGTYLIVADAGWTFTGKQARWYNNDSATYAPMNYGLLYNWNAAVDTFNTAYGETSVNTSGSDAVSLIFTRNRRGICPAGWHLPSEAEWTALANYVGSQSEYTCDNNSNNIAKALASTEGWDSYSGECNPGDQSVTANNATGFSAVPVGKYWLDGFNNASNRTYFWSSPENNYGSSNAYCCSLNFNSPNVGWGHEGKFSGFSVRCLRD